jgi:predicted phage terminase large subunit-like protein
MIAEAERKARPAYAPDPIPCADPDCEGDLYFAGSRWKCRECGINVIRPQRGPQERFSASPADIVIYGGSAGGGKSWALLFEAARHVRTPRYSAVIFRRTSPEITALNGLWDESTDLYPVFGGRSRESDHEWRFPTAKGGLPSKIAFRHMQYENDKLKHHGAQYSFIGFDELTTFTETQFWYLFSRNRSLCGVRPVIRCSTNPDPNSWVRKLIDWWIDEEGDPVPERDGVLRYFLRDGNDLVWGDSPEEVIEQAPGRDLEDVKSLTFIRSQLEDNQILMEKDPGYRATLRSLPKVERTRLLGGNWNIVAEAGDYFSKLWFEVVAEAPKKLKKVVRAWDLAATKPSKKNPNPDWTVAVKMGVDDHGIVWILDILRIREAPLGNKLARRRIAQQDGIGVHQIYWQDPGQAGKDQIANIKTELLGFYVESVVARKDKVTYALPASSAAEAGNIKVVAGPNVDAYLSTLEAFGGKDVHDDDVDATSLGFMKLVRSKLERLRMLATL